MRTNNRMPIYKPKELEKETKMYRTVKNGKSFWVKGEKPDPYKGVSCDSLSLSSRIETGVFESHEGVARKMEKADGFDSVNQQVNVAISEMESKNAETRRFNARKFSEAEAERKLKELRDKQNV